MPTSKHPTPFLETAFTAVCAELTRRKAKDPFTPISVLLPTGELAGSFRRFLMESGSWVNVRVETPRAFFERVGEAIAVRSGRAYVDGAEFRKIVEIAAGKLPLKAMRGVLEFPSFSAFLVKTIQDLRLCAIPSDKLAEVTKPLGERGRELAELVRECEKALGDAIDYVRGTELAAKCEETILVAGDAIRNLSSTEARILAAQKPHRIDWPEPIGGKPEILSARFPEQEIKEVLRRILREKVPFDRTAIIAPTNYFDLISDVAHGLNVPVSFSEPVGRPSTAVRMLELLFSILESDFRYDDLRRFLILRGRSGFLRVLGRAGTMQGYDNLRLAVEKRIEEKKEEGNSAAVETEFLAYLEVLSAAGSGQPKESARSLAQLLPDGAEKHLALQIIEEVLPHDQSGDLPAFRRAVMTRLGAVKQTRIHPSGAVRVTSSLFPGLYDLIFAVGVTEDHYPRRVREDPLLSDMDRNLLNEKEKAGLITTDQRVKTAADDFRRALSSARKAFVCTFPERDPVSGAPLFASYALIEVETVATGNAPDLEAYRARLQAAQKTFPPSADDAVDILEWQYSRLLGAESERKRFADHMLSAFPAARKHREALEEFRKPEFTPRQGILGADLSVDDHPYSPSEIEAFVNCPYSWFLKRRIRVYEEPAATDLYMIQANERGLLVHEIAQKVMAPGAGLDRLDEIAATVLDREKSRQLRPAFIVEAAEKQVHDALALFKKYQESLPPDRKTVEREFEIGREEHGKRVWFKAGDKRIALGGRIDRVDIQDGQALILDYKTGKPTIFPSFASGDMHPAHAPQPGLYAELYERVSKKTVSATGFVDLNKSATEFLRPYDKAHRAEVQELLDFFVDALSTGSVFPTGNCDYCPYTEICGSHIGVAVDAKAEKSKLPAFQKRASFRGGDK